MRSIIHDISNTWVALIKKKKPKESKDRKTIKNETKLEMERFFLMNNGATLSSQISNWYPKEGRAMCVSGGRGFPREEQKITQSTNSQRFPKSDENCKSKDSGTKS